jgi:hypothetical protein
MRAPARPVSLPEDASRVRTGTTPRINAGEMNVVDIPAVRKWHPGLMDFRTWLARTGAARLRALLPQHRPGEVLSTLPAWQLSEASSPGPAA